MAVDQQFRPHRRNYVLEKYINFKILAKNYIIIINTGNTILIDQKVTGVGLLITNTYILWWFK